MKKQLFLFSLFVFGLTANAQQSTTVNLSMQPGYTDQVYYEFSTNTQESFTVDSWDIAFLRTSTMAFATRINAGKGIEVYQASDSPSDWSSIDPANIDSWTQLFNSDTTWTVGAFDQGTATYGWGEYNPSNHHVEGTVIFVLKYADGSFKKFMLEDFFGGYTFKYADWDANTSTWEADETYTLSNSNNSGYLFNYYNLTTDSEVMASPALANWDLVFQQFSTDVGGGMMYTVTGVLQNPNASVAENIEPNGPETNNLSFSDDINSIGYDWKSYESGGYTLEADKYYYIKEEDGTVYRMHFLGYEGSSTGNLSFEFQDVSGLLSTVNFDAENSFSIYPNPATDKRIHILYEINSVAKDGTISIFSLTGKKVFESSVENNGFYKQTLNLSFLSNGIYLVRFQAGEYTTTQKIVLN